MPQGRAYSASADDDLSSAREKQSVENDQPAKSGARSASTPDITDFGFEPLDPFDFLLFAEVSPGPGAALSHVSAYLGDGVTWTEETMTYNADSERHEAVISATRGRVNYIYVAAVDTDGNRTAFPPGAESSRPYYFDIPLYEDGTQILDLNFESQTGLGVDASAAGHFANILGGAELVDNAELGSMVLEMDGIDDAAEVLSAFLGYSDAFALEIKFHVDDFRAGTDAGNWMYLINKPIACSSCWSEEAFSILWGMNDNPYRQLAARFWNPAFGSSMHASIELATSLQTGTWYHAILEVKPSDHGPQPFVAVLQLRDGTGNLIEQGEVPLAVQPGMEFAPWPMQIGNIGDRGFLDGRIDDVAFYNYAHFGLTSTARENTAEIPARYILQQNYPNPFNPVTTIEFQLPVAEQVCLEVFDLLGRRVTTILDGIREAGVQRVQFDANQLPSGTYMYRLAAGDFAETRYMTLVK